jgi:phytanoyl-CoA hydroxylase
MTDFAQLVPGRLGFADPAPPHAPYPDGWLGVADVVEGPTRWLHVGGVTDAGARRRALVEHPHLLALLQRIIGAPPEFLYDRALLKPTRIGREKPWHQDLSMFEYAPDTDLVGVWVALDEAGSENGCMHVVPVTHREGVIVHFRRRDFPICDTSVAAARVVAVPLEPRGLLQFHGLLHHATPPNTSLLRRRVLQC